MHRHSEGLRAAYRALEYTNKPRGRQNQVNLSTDECLNNIGLGYLLSEEHTSALSYFREALRVNPENESAKGYIEWIENKPMKKGELVGNY